LCSFCGRGHRSREKWSRLSGSRSSLFHLYQGRRRGSFQRKPGGHLPQRVHTGCSYRRSQRGEYFHFERNRDFRGCHYLRNLCSGKYQRGLCPAEKPAQGSGGRMKNTEIQGAIFDVDGTLLDSMGYWEHLGDEYLMSRQLQPPENLANLLASMTLLEAAEYFRERYGLQEEGEEMIRDFDRLMAV